MKINYINSAETLELRSKILRPGFELKFSQFEGDSEVETFHLGVFADHSTKNPISIGTFMKRVCRYFPDIENSFQLRGMATDSNFQGKGCGRMILLEAEKILKNQKCPLLWMNARLSAIEFYRKCGYLERGDEFEIPQVGPHKVMYKHLV